MENHKKVLCILLIILIILIFIGIKANQTYVCKECEKTTFTIYYDVDGDESFCKECAKKYWIPLDYERFRVEK